MFPIRLIKCMCLSLCVFEREGGGRWTREGGRKGGRRGEGRGGGEWERGQLIQRLDDLLFWMKYHDPERLKEERIYFGLWFWRDTVHLHGKSRPDSRGPERLITCQSMQGSKGRDGPCFSLSPPQMLTAAQFLVALSIRSPRLGGGSFTNWALYPGLV